MEALKTERFLARWSDRLPDRSRVLAKKELPNGAGIEDLESSRYKVAAVEFVASHSPAGCFSKDAQVRGERQRDDAVARAEKLEARVCELEGALRRADDERQRSEAQVRLRSAAAFRFTSSRVLHQAPARSESSPGECRRRVEWPRRLRRTATGRPHGSSVRMYVRSAHGHAHRRPCLVRADTRDSPP